MAQIDLKYAMLSIQDGYGATGAVNLMAGYTTGATTMIVDGFTIALSVGDTFTVVGETQPRLHTITAHSETSGDTTSITFTPALNATVADNAVLVVMPHTLEINIGEGNLTWTETRAIVYKMSYGLIKYAMLGDQTPMDVSFDFVWEFLKSATGEPVTPKEALTQSGAASSWMTTDTDTCQPYAVNLILTYNPPCINVYSEIITFPNFRQETLDQDLRNGTIAVKGKCLAQVIEDNRQAQ